MKALNKEQIFVTKLASTGGFLSKGNTTFISGVDDDMVEKTIAIIKEHSKRRTQIMPVDYAQYNPGISSYPVEITVGGATVFVLDVERFEKL
ncbi:MAG: cyclic-di-AMP receptor [Clostridia bacterium]|nr:cyclic-di-AMP receptor [Clostridia bacterium]